MPPSDSFAKSYLLSQGIGRETRKRCQGVPITERRDTRVLVYDAVAPIPMYERGDLP